MYIGCIYQNTKIRLTKLTNVKKTEEKYEQQRESKEDASEWKKPFSIRLALSIIRTSVALGFLAISVFCAYKAIFWKTWVVAGEYESEVLYYLFCLPIGIIGIPGSIYWMAPKFWDSVMERIGLETPIRDVQEFRNKWLVW